MALILSPNVPINTLILTAASVFTLFYTVGSSVLHVAYVRHMHRSDLLCAIGRQ